MKKITFHVFLFLGCCFFWSCEHEVETILELDKTELTLAHLNGLGTIQITSSEAWDVIGTPDWISVDHSFIDELSGEIYISATTNDSFEQRTATLAFTNGHISKTVTVTQLSLQEADPFIRFNNSAVYISPLGDETTIELIANRPWKIENAPEWLTVSPLSGNESAVVHFKANEHRGIKQRAVDLSFNVDGVTSKLFVKQPGLSDIIRGPHMSIFRTKEMGFSSLMTDCDVKTNQIFVNPNITGKIFLGNLVAHDMGESVDIPQFTGYTFKPVTISTSALDEKREWEPSLDAQSQFANDIISREPQESISFIEDDGSFEFYTYRLLHAVGMVNFGVKLDEIVNGNSHAQNEMEDKYGLLFSFKRIAFTLDLNLSPGKTVIQETLEDADRDKGVSYVSSVGYGNLGLLVVQSTSDSQYVRKAINKFLEGISLSPDETSLVESCEICYVYFDNHNQVQCEKNPTEALNAYKAAKISTDFENIYPVEFRVSDFASHTRNTLSYILNFTLHDNFH